MRLLILFFLCSANVLAMPGEISKKRAQNIIYSLLSRQRKADLIEHAYEILTSGVPVHLTPQQEATIQHLQKLIAETRETITALIPAGHRNKLNARISRWNTLILTLQAGLVTPKNTPIKIPSEVLYYRRLLRKTTDLLLGNRVPRMRRRA